MLGRWDLLKIPKSLGAVLHLLGEAEERSFNHLSFNDYLM